jgi:hypothetical protein
MLHQPGSENGILGDLNVEEAKMSFTDYGSAIATSVGLPAVIAMSRSTDKSPPYGVSDLISSNKTPSTRRNLACWCGSTFTATSTGRVSGWPPATVG